MRGDRMQQFKQSVVDACERGKRKILDGICPLDEEDTKYPINMMTGWLELIVWLAIILSFFGIDFLPKI